MTLMNEKALRPFLIRRDDYEAEPAGMEAYFDYTMAVRRISDWLCERYCCGFHLYYQEDSDDAWDGLADDIRSGYAGVEHAISLFDLVETRSFKYASDPAPDADRDRKPVAGGKSADGAHDIRMAVRNNVFVYPAHRVAFARVPRLAQYGLGYEDLIFAESDAQLGGFLAELRERQLADRQLLVFTDTRDGLERSRETTERPVDREGVFMDESLKAQIFRSVDTFFAEDRSFYQTYGVPYKRGILLYGKPGNGKTTLVKSISATVNAPVAYWQITEFTGSESIQQVFDAAVKLAPMVLVVEDIDSMPESCRSYFLNTLDGATSREGIFLIGTTNYPEKIDPALMNRAGRFDRAYEVKLPSETLRLAYLTYKGAGRLADEAGIAEIARLTEGFTFAQLAELYVSAALELHQTGATDWQRLIAGMKTDLSKGRSREWMTEGAGRKVGFSAGN
ncbi:ATP-binding protein [Cohnella ginsengisoli]|uniref:ATP-binding protein n=1 Tax=Cohnella ginsengisoli TaxID=425004 RepID=A0A9X4KMU8_9BACL|nr:ATP-binding protein [Cohnella ginsengisoli]MDG0794815.1 ATP-binding protein [Cohnella ginsengisoli]